MPDYSITVTESDRQMIIVALAKLKIERPGWDWALGVIADKLDARDMYEHLTELYQSSLLEAGASVIETHKTKEQ